MTPTASRAPRLAALALLTALGLGARLRGAATPPFDFHPTRQYYALLFAQDYRHRLCGDPRSPEALAARANREGEALLEPPVVPALTALGWCALGRESLALPRVLMSLAWCLGALAAAWLTRALGGGALAPLVAATWCLFHPYALAAGRSAQPDVPMVALLLLGAACLARGRDDPSPRWSRRAAAALGAAVLVKLVAVFFAAPLVAWRVLRGRAMSLRDKGLFALTVAPAALWYAGGWFVEGSLRHQGSGRFRPALLGTAVFWRDLATRVDTVTDLRAFYAAVAVAALVLRGPARAVSLAWLLGQVALGIAFTQHIYTHDYYLLPLLPWVGVTLALGAHAALPQGPRARILAHALALPLALALAARGTARAWRDADASLRLGAPVVDDARRLGAALGHRRDVLMQAPWYGLPHKFHGRFAAEYWPDHVDLADDPRPWSPAERVRRAYPGHTFARFVVADPAEVTAQPALWQMLTTRCTPTLRDARLAVFACEGLRP
ncbi:MAG: glycosyltransferase family 39 protein [Polyangiales bacterium]